MVPSPSWISRINVPSPTAIRQILYGVILGVSLSIASTSLAVYYQARKRERLAAQYQPRPIELRRDEVLSGVTGLIGNTPLIRINSLSDALGVEILGKAEFLNPGGSVKDRVALRMIEDAEKNGLLYPYTGSRIFEGTVGSTGISIATIAVARGYNATIIMPDDVAEEKVKALHALGAEVERVRPASIVDKKQATRRRAIEFGKQSSMDRANSLTDNGSSHLLKSPSSVVISTLSTHATSGADADPRADEDIISKPRGFFADQFENKSNFDAHFDGTGPEIWRQTDGRVDAFVSGAAGVGQYLKSMNEDVIVALADPEGSGLYNKVPLRLSSPISWIAEFLIQVKYGVMFDRKEAEGTKRRHQVDTVVEGIGINRLTNNIELALPIIDDAFRITDAEAVSMSRYLVHNDGLFLGSSSACNLVACVKLVRQMGWKDGQKIVTILCDSGTRHYSKNFASNLKLRNDEYLRTANIPNDSQIVLDLLDTPITSSSE
ncbi:hypothetical protein PC9H_007123 [Pleurotus ostreatus]|uniref:cysteine synthase n=1 Tax=Pleurotus ostreatus TaxID=5322 RepID=A0A8H7DPW5_PLEOS|nr:uncharacterized protein PC9H_007123 [Pleurotus ostreatus]KAF7427906.1 hypothetical protein PC9H_007123 [Pleurotus ostreatus]